MLIIEDGTAKADAQSYATAAELVAFAAARGIDLPATEPEQEQLLINAIDYMESLRYVGIRYTRDQALSWPRANAIVDGWYVAHNELPRQLKAAQLQLAIDSMTLDLMGNVVPSTERVVLEEEVEGAVAVKYAPPAAAPTAILGATGVTPDGAQLTRARSLLRPLVASIGQVRVMRG